jgi:uncharacterized protein (DUF433 family)
METAKLEFSPSEAAFIADLPVREVQKAFDEDWFAFVPRATAARRWLGPVEVLHLRVIKDAGRHVVFPTETKKLIHRQLRARLVDFQLVSTDGALLIAEAKAHRHTRSSEEREWGALRLWLVRIAQQLKEPVRIKEISLDVAGAWTGMADRLAETAAAQLAVVTDPEIRGGEPVVRGTRIPAHMLHELAAKGATEDELLGDYPSLDAERLRLALRWAENHPRQGRPRKRPWRQDSVAS